MVRAWYMDDSAADQRLEHQRNPAEFLSLEELFRQTGVEYFKVSKCAVRLYARTADSIVLFEEKMSCLFLFGCFLGGEGLPVLESRVYWMRFW